ncbi:PefC/AfrB family outer membrane usher protein [Salmonella enterica subsp. diarizonae serovar 47:k:z53:[z84]]|nr:PefC/AfrB family outer membrane usher protein [Salmonella enterica subsp. diarizonae serovar 47:k:z53:[z84]]
MLPLRLFKLSALSFGVVSSFALASEDELNLDFLQGTKVVPSVLKSNSPYPAGQYSVDVLVNNESVGRMILVISPEEDVAGQLCFSTGWLKDANVPLRLRDYQPVLNEKAQCYVVGKDRYTRVDFNYGAQTLAFTIPQSYLISKTDPSRWDYGINAGRLKYSSNFNKTSSQKVSAYGNVDAVLNLGRWVLTSNMNGTRDSTGRSKFAARDMTFSTAISQVQGDFTLGKSQTRSELFSDFIFYGVALRSNSNMAPWEARGYAPVISGVANSTSRITIIQNGYTMYSKVVPPGPYQLDDVRPVGNGDLEVTVEDASGHKTKTLYPVTTLPTLLRPGELQYNLAIGKKNRSNELKNAFSSDAGTFWLGSAGYGFPNTTLNATTILHTQYQAGGLGVTQTLGLFGAVSANASMAQAHYRNGSDKQGGSVSAKYAKSFTDKTDLQLLAYRYQSKGYVEFADFEGDSRDTLYNKKARYEMQLSQRLGDSNLNLSAWREDYWWLSRYASGVSLSASSVIVNDVSLYLSGNYSKRPYNYHNKSEDYSVSLGVSVPFTLGGVRHYSSSSVGYTRQGGATFNTGVSASPTDRMSYNLNTQASEKGERSVSGALGYGFDTVQTNVSLSQSRHQTSVAGSVSGQVLGTPESGVLFTKENSDTVGIVRIPDVSGVRFNGSVPTNSRGYTVVSLSDYTLNRINIDMENVPDDLELQTSSYNVVPTEKAVVYRQFGAEYVQRYILQVKDRSGKVLDGGNATTAQGLGAGFIANNGVLMMSMLSEPKSVQVDLGDGKTCRFSMAGITPNANKVQEVRCE